MELPAYINITFFFIPLLLPCFSLGPTDVCEEHDAERCDTDIQWVWLHFTVSISLYMRYCVFVSQRWQRAAQDKTNEDDTVRAQTHSFPPTSTTNSTFFPSLQTRSDTSRCGSASSGSVTRSCQQIQHTTQGSMELLSWCGNQDALFWAGFFFFYPSQAKEFLIDLAGRLRQRMRRRSVRQVADLCWSAQPTHFT